MSKDTEAQFTKWLCEQMPAGTVISNPAWWAPRILRASLADAPAVPVQAAASEKQQIAGMVVEIMQDAWCDDIADTGCAPDDFTIEDGNKIAFQASTWAQRVGRFVAERLAATPAAVQQGPEALPTQAESNECYASWAQYVMNLNGAPASTSEAYRAAWFMSRAALAPTPQAPHPTDTLDPQIEGRLSVWLTPGKELHPLTVNLVVRFARALAAKLADAEKKYGYSDGWHSEDWMDECRAKLLEHVAKGDPRDVAAYCAFLWHHGESTAVTPATQAEMVATGWAPIGPQGQPDLSEIAWNDEDCHDLAEGWTWKPVSLVAASPLPAQAPAVPLDISEPNVEAVTDEGGIDYCVSIYIGRDKFHTPWMRSEKKAEALSETLRSTFGRAIGSASTSEAAPQAEAVQAPEARERTPKDYTIEHAEYMAKGAERLLEALNAEDALRLRREESDDVDEDSIYDAGTDRAEAERGLRSDIYEFRKRRDRARSLASDAAQTDSKLLEQAEKALDEWRRLP